MENLSNTWSIEFGADVTRVVWASHQLCSDADLALLHGMAIVKISLTQGEQATIDAADYDLVRGFRWYAARRGNRTYAATAYTVDGKKQHVHMHRLLLNAPPGVMVIHLNGDTLDNRRENLSLSGGHHPGSPSWGKSRFRGVSWHVPTSSWRAEIQVTGEKRFLGFFPTEEKAAEAYAAEAARVYHESTISHAKNGR